VLGREGRTEPEGPIPAQLLIHHLFRLDAQRCVGHSSQPCFIDELAGYAADAIGLVLNAHQGFFEMVDKGDLAACHLAQLFSFHAHAAVLHSHVSGVIVVAAHLIFAGDQTLQVSQFLFSCVQFAVDQFPEFSKF
jgi:hypothetical protein